MLRRIFEDQRQEVKGNWRKLHDKEHHNLYLLKNIRPSRLVKSRTTSMEYSKHMRDYKEMQNCRWKPER